MVSGTLTRTRGSRHERLPHDERTDVKLAGDWLDRWLLELDQAELRTYLQLAHYYNTRTYHDEEGLSKILPGRDVSRVVGQLERRGLVEVIKKGKDCHYHFPHRDREGFHRADPARPSLADALAFQERMSNELLDLTEKDETEELRQKVFGQYPQLRDEYNLYRSSADPAAPRWRLWMELSRLLIREFEQKYGSLKEDHGELFKEASSKVLRHHLDVIDGVVSEVLSRVEEFFPEVQETWVISPDEDDFVARPFVRRLAQRYGIGPEQAYLNTIEALGQQGRVVVAIDPEGYMADMILPSDTGLTKSEERVLFLRPEERHQTDSPRNQERVRRSRNKYANYLIGQAVRTLADFVALDRVRRIDAALFKITDLVNDSLSLLSTHDGSAPVHVEHVIDRFDGARQGLPEFSPSGDGSWVQGRQLSPEEAAALRKRTTEFRDVLPIADKKKPKQKAAKKKPSPQKKAAKKKPSPQKKPVKKKPSPQKKAAKKKPSPQKKAAKKKPSPKKKAAKKRRR